MSAVLDLLTLWNIHSKTTYYTLDFATKGGISIPTILLLWFVLFLYVL